MHYVQVLRFRDGKHVSFNLMFDRLLMLEQLGLAAAVRAASRGSNHRGRRTVIPPRASVPRPPALAALAALGLPATAQADVTTAVNGHTLTVTGSAGTDTITLRAAGGVITVNDVPPR